MEWHMDWHVEWHGNANLERFFRDNLKLREIFFETRMRTTQCIDLCGLFFYVLINSYLGSQNVNQNPR